MGAVFAGRHLDSGLQVALKTVPALGEDANVRKPWYLDRLALEWMTLSRMTHPSIPRVYEAGQADFGQGFQPCFAMELVNGRSATDVCASLSDFERLELFASICDAISYVHQMGFVHCDLKPLNVIVGDMRRPVVVDFGAVHKLGDPMDGIICTPNYWDPRRDHIVDSFDAAIDLYSLGLILYELFTGQLPFSRTAGPITTTEFATGGLAAPVSELLPHPNIAAIVNRCIKGPKRKRYREVHQLAVDVRRHSEGRTLLPDPGSLLYTAAHLRCRFQSLWR